MNAAPVLALVIIRLPANAISRESSSNIKSIYCLNSIIHFVFDFMYEWYIGHIGNLCYLYITYIYMTY